MVGVSAGFAAETPQAGAISRGAYLIRAAGCVTCHTDKKHGGKPFAGGRGIPTPFGTFYSPNITPDADTGIGRWSDADFLRALKRGVRPDGADLFPVLPYTSYTRMSDADALAIKAYLFSLPPVHQENKPHDVKPFAWRFPVKFWKWLFFTPGDFKPDPAASAEVNRGAYLVTALAHCGECHTPRNFAGALRTSLPLAGTADGPEGERAPNITPDKATGIGKWSADDLVTLLKTGTKPDFDNVQGTMAAAIDDGFKYLTDTDLQAIAAYILSRPPIDHLVPRRTDRP
ncbi:MAG TPA: cytochrome c [Candidatus Sulfotelmatobacter sp.]|nr:cytochrome c [Candidatus Sulfotelmatobacter sp.]